jgi:hypothetical protein
MMKARINDVCPGVGATTPATAPTRRPLTEIAPEIDVPRDIGSTFDPQVLEKRRVIGADEVFALDEGHFEQGTGFTSASMAPSSSGGAEFMDRSGQSKRNL